ncbi:MAG: hypothetical protein JSS48_00860 [Nitrospira sp.]|nr:hypothetical protein [Nitrospira sp.]MBX3336774.1 hypothetical protein [Nitrospira sp.]MCW5778356.1 hypothetical protein [Nitrospira sp.]
MLPEMIIGSGKAEIEIQTKLRNFVKSEIDRRRLTVNDVAKELNLLPSGAQALLERKVWSIETGLRIAQQLSCNLEISIKPKK